MQKLFIAVIDDDEDDVMLLKECFKKYNSIDVISFSSSQHFLETLMHENTPCLLVVDLHLPDIRGIDLIDLIRERPALANIPIVVYTTGYSRSEKLICDEMKIQLYKKPDTFIEWDHIAQMMAQHCDHSL